MRIWPAIVSFAALAVASNGETASAQSSSEDLVNRCRVAVDRSANAGTFDVVRQEFSNGRCVCAVTTGPQSQPSSIEERVRAILNSRSCPDARSVAMVGQSGNQLSIPLGLMGIGAAVTGIVLASDTDRPVSP